MKRADLAEHLALLCDKRRMTCEVCKETITATNVFVSVAFDLRRTQRADALETSARFVKAGRYLHLLQPNLLVDLRARGSVPGMYR